MDDGITHLRNLLLSIDLFLGSLLSTLDSLLLYLYINAGSPAFQDGMFHKKMIQISDKMRIDISTAFVLY